MGVSPDLGMMTRKVVRSRPCPVAGTSPNELEFALQLYQPAAIPSLLLRTSSARLGAARPAWFGSRD